MCTPGEALRGVIGGREVARAPRVDADVLHPQPTFPHRFDERRVLSHDLTTPRSAAVKARADRIPHLLNECVLLFSPGRLHVFDHFAGKHLSRIG